MERSTRIPALETAPLAVPLPAGRVRELLRRLRDHDLHGATLALSGGDRVRVRGCLSRDVPVESSLRYCVRFDGRPDHVLEIRGGEGRLDLEIHEEGSSEILRRLSYEVLSDGAGRATVPELRARARPDSNDPLEIEHFLRRIVRAGFVRLGREG